MRKPPDVITFYRYPVVSAIALLAAAVSIAWWTKVDVSSLWETDAVRKGQIWRLLTSMLPHINFMHLAFNLYWLWVFGTLFEETFGHLRTLAVILILALGSGAADYAVCEGGVGLSGVCYGLWGAALVLSWLDARFRGAVDAQTHMLFIAWFILCIVVTVKNVMPIANVAHGAGAVLGAIIALPLANRRPRLGWSAIAALVVVLIIGATIIRPWINFTRAGAATESRLGYEALVANDNRAALTHLRHATRMDPTYAGAWYNLGLVLQRFGRNEEAPAAFHQAFMLDPSDKQMKETWEQWEAYLAARGK
ncbi:MAG TPA: rhomboid family intramembrane serine protease [Tepidisphaeraceae bacterium]|jgi:membrane associated rhomboid family serine protease|nr:rhomboid family intramembrane serine protease [Tepidisphaeraceae bacterium]